MDAQLPYEEMDLHGGSDRRAELMLGTLVCCVLLVVGAMGFFVLREAVPSFAHNGLHWFGPGGSVDDQMERIFVSGDLRQKPVYELHAWPLLWSTLLITGGAVVIAFVSSLFVAVFIVEFAPEW